MARRVLAWALAGACGATAACGGSGGGGDGGGPPPGPPAPVGPLAALEAEFNGTFATANPLPADGAGQGDTALALDVDFWSFAGTGGATVTVELAATRLDQAGWDAAGSVPTLTLFMPDGVTKILEHEASGTTIAGWGWGLHDLDFPAVRLPTTGTYFLRVGNDPGTAPGAAYVVSVRDAGLGAVQQEAEPEGATGINDTTAAAQAISTGVVRGWHGNGEVDAYSFVVPAPAIVGFETTAHRDGAYAGATAYYDPLVRLVASDGVSVVQSGDQGFFSDATFAFFVTVPGTYYVLVDQFAAGGSAAYFLTYTQTAAGTITESEPNGTTGTANAMQDGQITNAVGDLLDDDFYSFSGTAGDLVRVTLFDVGAHQAAIAPVFVEFRDPSGAVHPSDFTAFGDASPRVLRTVLTSTGTWFLRVFAAGPSSSYAVRFQRVAAAAFESEPNGSNAGSDAFDASRRAAGVVSAPGDVDVFRFEARASEVVTLSVLADQQGQPTGSDGAFVFSGHGSALRPRVRVHDGAAFVAQSTYTPPTAVVTPESAVDPLPTASVVFVAPADGTYFVHVEDEGGLGASSFHYVVTRR
jgi:hypothetical protein